MKVEERELARNLRRQGFSVNEICKRVKAAKGSISRWIRDIELTQEQLARIENNYLIGREKSRKVISEQRKVRWAAYKQEAEREYIELSKNPEFMFGLALYIGEGTKAQDNSTVISNCDYRVIQKSIKFFEQIGVLHEKIKCTIIIHSDSILKDDEIINYWQTFTGLPINQFGKVCYATSTASKHKKGNIQPYGVCQIRVFSTEITQKLYKWMELALS